MRFTFLAAATTVLTATVLTLASCSSPVGAPGCRAAGTAGRTIVAVSETTSDGRIQLGCTFTDNYSDYGLSSRAVRISNYHDCPSYRIIDDVNGEFPGPDF